MTITAHTLVKNEERFLWYSVKSVIEHVDYMLLWDMGSDDKTIEIIKLLQKEYPNKIKTKFLNSGDIYNFTDLRQKMLEDDINADWVIIVDGDEIWWDHTIKKLVATIRKNSNFETIISSYYNCVGDIFHYQDESMGKYSIDSKKGHITIRAMNKKLIKGLHYDKPHGQQGIFDENNILIQERDHKKRFDLTTPKSYLHMTHLRRSNLDSEKNVPKRTMKFKFNVGHKFPFDFYYPEVFFQKRPAIVKSVFEKRTTKYEYVSKFYDLGRIIKNLIPIKERSGY